MDAFLVPKIKWKDTELIKTFMFYMSEYSDGTYQPKPKTWLM